MGDLALVIIKIIIIISLSILFNFFNFSPTLVFRGLKIIIIIIIIITRTVLTRRVSSYGLPAWVSSELGPMGEHNLYNVRSSIGTGSLLRARFTNRDLT